MTRYRIYWWLSALNVGLLAFHLIPVLAVDRVLFSLFRSACYIVAAIIFGVLAWKSKPAPRADVGIVLHGVEGWKFDRYDAARMAPAREGE